MKKILHYFLAVIAISIFSGCISQKDYEEQAERLAYYQEEANEADSLRLINQRLHNESLATEAQLKSSVKDLERLAVTNQSLNQNYQDLLGRYNRLLDQNKNMLSTSTYEKQSLQEQLAAQQAELDEKARNLANLESELQMREARLNMMESEYDNMEGSLAERNKRILELESMLSNQEERMSSVSGTLQEALLGFSQSDLTVTERDGKIYVSLSQNLLFRSGSTNIEWKGRQALAKLATVLNDNTDMDIMVEGHTDTDGSVSKNWDLSVLRATSVVKTLTTNGVDPTRIIAAGRGIYAPLASNSTRDGKAKNRRVEIILSPNLDQLYELINTR